MPSPFLDVQASQSPVNDDFYENFIQLEVEDNADGPSTFKIKLPYGKGDSGDWEFSAQDDLELFNTISISAKFLDGTKQNLIDGYITNINAHIGSNEEDSYVEIMGMDKTLLMSLVEKEATYVAQSDSDIASSIFSSYGFTADVDTTPAPPQDDSYTVIQRGTDIQFLKSLALRNGFQCFVDKATPSGSVKGIFKKIDLSQSSQGTLYVQFADKTNIVSIDFFVDGLRPVFAEIKQQDACTAQITTTTQDGSDLSALGRTNLSSSQSGSLPNEMKILLSRYTTANQQQMTNLVNSAVDDGSWFVAAKGTVNAEYYAAVLEAKKLLTIYGAGSVFSGDYYVTKVTHKFMRESYLQDFEAKRNALEIKES